MPDECQHDVTIGKLYNGTCYFSSIDRNYMFPTTSENLNGTIAYRPAVISDNAGVRILQQLAFELSDALDVKKLGFYAQPRLQSVRRLRAKTVDKTVERRLLSVQRLL